MEVLRTPDERFAAVPDFALDPQYVEVDDGDGGALRLAYVTAGPIDGEPVLLLHGEPSWSFLYRTVIPVLTAAGLRAVAPDLIGFGRSDKAGRAVGAHLRPPRRLAAGGAVRAAGPARHHARRPGLGRTARPAAGGGAPRAVRP